MVEKKKKCTKIVRIVKNEYDELKQFFKSTIHTLLTTKSIICITIVIIHVTTATVYVAIAIIISWIYRIICIRDTTRPGLRINTKLSN
jgi:hypothetical protein